MAMTTTQRRRIERRLELNRERLDMYLAQEQKILEGQARAYQIGSRNISRYEVDLADLRETIDELEKKIAEDEDLLAGKRPRKALAFVPRHW